jgi:hypothetical protein
MATSSLPRPPIRRRIACRNLGPPERHQIVPLVWIPDAPANNPCSACTAPAHRSVWSSAGARCRARQPDACRSRGGGPQGRGARIERVAEGRRGLRRSLEGQHTLGPGVASELVGSPARLNCRSAAMQGDAVEPAAGFGAHGGRMRRAGGVRKPYNLRGTRRANPTVRANSGLDKTWRQGHLDAS